VAPPEPEAIYDPRYIETLFDEMAGTYEKTNYVSSFGFSQRWRAQCVRGAHLEPGMVVVDLMTGMGECWAALRRRIGTGGRIVAVDISSGMLKHASARLEQAPLPAIEIRHEDALATGIETASADRVVSAFGLKTFSEEQIRRLALQVRRILKPGGCFSLIEISVPRPWWLRWPYLFYLNHVIPWIGRLFLGNPANYRMLGTYTERFGDARRAMTLFHEQGFEVEYRRYFLGCATGFVGRWR
jgi:ubiquinone/menaquinone biosynthesis methyltransferase